MNHSKGIGRDYLCEAARQSLSFFLLAYCAIPAASQAESLHFDPAFLSDDPSAVAALDQFEKGISQPPGRYRVDLWLNSQRIDTRDVVFVLRQDALAPCFTELQLSEMGVNVGQLSAFHASEKTGECLALTDAVADSVADYNVNQQTLKITIPQALIKPNARGYIAPEKWDNGIPAFLLNYQYHGSSGYGAWAGDDGFLNIQSGLNLGPWRLRDYSTYTYQHGNDSESQADWQHISTAITRPIIALRSALTLGDTYTDGQIFESVNLRGAQLSSDDSMYPDSQRGFAPTVHGVAKSNAQVTVRQNSYVIYQTYVPAGAFVIDDLYPTSSSGDLEVTVKEADGSENQYIVPYAAVPYLQREGHLQYNIAVGKYNSNDSQQETPTIAQGQFFWGMPLNTTLYGGAQWSENYRAEALGFGFNLGMLGAISLDAIHADSILPDDSKHSGESYRFLYSKTLEATNTHFQLAGYRYSTKNYYTLEDTTWRHMKGDRSSFNEDDDDIRTLQNTYDLYQNQRAQVQLNISQSFDEYGSLYLNANRQDYWNSDEKNTSIQLGYSSSLKSINYSLNYSYSHTSGAEDDRILSLNISVPLSQLLAGDTRYDRRSNSAWLGFNNSSDNSGRVTNAMTLSGNLLDDHTLNYSLQQGIVNQGVGYSGNASLSYRAAKAQANVAYSYDRNSQRVNYGLQGSLLAHANGITLSQSLGDTNVLVKAPGAEGVALENATGIRTDSRGYAVIPWATAYRENRVALRATDLGDNIEVDNNIAYVVPTKGAIVRAEFTARVGWRGLITLIHDGRSVPFGATVTLDNDAGTSIVGDEGQVFLGGLPATGQLLARWGNDANQQCKATFTLPIDNAVPVIQTQAECL